MKKYQLLFLIFGLLSCKSDHKKEEIIIQKELKQGTYRAALTVQDNKELPFNFKVDSDKKITVLNAEEKIIVEELTVVNDSVFIKMPVFDAVIEAAISERGDLNGVYMKAPQNRRVPFTAIYDAHFRYPLMSKSQEVGGKWEVTFSPGTESEYKAVGIFKDGEGNKISGTFLTETGDYRFLEGAVDQTLKLSCFDGAHAFLFDGVVKGDSIISGNFYSGNHYKEPWIAVRNDKFELTSPDKLTYLKKGYDKIAFAFLDLNGKELTLENTRFKDKVTIIQIMGSWCPNCLDESKYLSKYYKENKDKGVELVALAFEAADQERAVKNLNRLKDALGINYPILIAQTGTTSKKEAAEKLPMLNHVLSYPTTIFIDKKGKVRKIHTGFNGPATGEKYTQFTTEFESFVAELTAE